MTTATPQLASGRRRNPSWAGEHSVKAQRGQNPALGGARLSQAAIELASAQAMSTGGLEKVSCGGSGCVSRSFLLLLGVGQRQAFSSGGQNGRVRQLRCSDKHTPGCSMHGDSGLTGPWGGPSTGTWQRTERAGQGPMGCQVPGRANQPSSVWVLKETERSGL